MTILHPSSRRKPRTFQEVVGVQYKQSMVPFVIPNTQRDDKRGMFITAELARRSEDPLVYDVYAATSAFYKLLNDLLFRFRKYNDQLAWQKAVHIASFPEVPELCFGYTQVGHRGLGMGAGALCRKILDTLRQYPGLAELCITQPDAIAFVPGVGLDRVSDAIGTIAKLELITYTQQQAQLHAFDPSCMQYVEVESVWNHRAQTRETVQAKLPVADLGPLLLVDKSIVRSSPPVRAEQYARKYGLSHLDSDALKLRILEQNKNDASALHAVFQDVFDHEHWIRPRREFQPSRSQRVK